MFYLKKKLKEHSRLIPEMEDPAVTMSKKRFLKSIGGSTALLFIVSAEKKNSRGAAIARSTNYWRGPNFSDLHMLLSVFYLSGKAFSKPTELPSVSPVWYIRSN